jgi:hypothetical protein
MATIKVTKRITDTNNMGIWTYVEVPNDCTTYSATIKKFNGKQDWYDKQAHQFVANGDLYIMSK